MTTPTTPATSQAASEGLSDEQKRRFKFLGAVIDSGLKGLDRLKTLPAASFHVACPKCGTEEWDHVTAERGRERDVPFNRCCRCETEWSAS